MPPLCSRPSCPPRARRGWTLSRRCDRNSPLRRQEVAHWIVYKSRAHRDRVNKKVMKDPRLAADMDPKSMPFDVKRMVCGGFKVIVDIT